MPYTVKDEDGKKCVYKKDSKEKVGCTDGPIEDYLGALYAAERKDEALNIDVIDDEHLTEAVLKRVVERLLKRK